MYANVCFPIQTLLGVTQPNFGICIFEKFEIANFTSFSLDPTSSGSRVKFKLSPEKNSILGGCSTVVLQLIGIGLGLAYLGAAGMFSAQCSAYTENM